MRWCVLSFLLTGSGHLVFGQQYSHHKLAQSDWVTGRLSDGGHYLYTFTTGIHYSTFLDDVEITGTYDGVPITSPGGINDRGDWVAGGFVGSEPFPQYRVVKNGRHLDAGWQTGPWTSHLPYPSKSGVAYWTNGGYVRAAVMRDGVEYSSQWTNGIYDNVYDVTDDGRAVWAGQGYGSTTVDLWFDGVNRTKDLDMGEYRWEGGFPEDQAVAANNLGSVAFIGKRPSSGPGNRHIFVDGLDVTTAAMGPTGGCGHRVFLNNLGQALWEGYFPNQNARVYLNNTVLFGDLLKDSDSVTVFGLNDNSAVLWQKDDSATHKSFLMVNRYDLTSAVYGHGFSYLGIRPFDMNERGQVLWAANSALNTWDLWLSTPVPEPSTLLLLLPGVQLLHRRGRHR